MRVQLAGPNQSLLSPEQYDQLFSMHGITMIFLFVTPMLSGFGNYLVPLQIGARDMAFPRLNALSYWVFLAAGLFIYSSLPLGIAPDDGWFSLRAALDALARLEPRLLRARADHAGHLDDGRSDQLHRHDGAAAGAGDVAQPDAALLLGRARHVPLGRLRASRRSRSTACSSSSSGSGASSSSTQPTAEARCCGSTCSGSSGTPTSTSSSCPPSGSSRRSSRSSRSARWSRRTWSILATMATALLGFGVWVHHMFAVGLPQLTMTFFAAASMTIAIPAAIQVFAWLATIVTGRPVLKSPFLYIVGFIVVFVIGGLSGVMFAVIPFDQQVTDSYFVVAHFHYVLFGGAVFPIFAALHYWLPKMSGRLFDERRAQFAFWLIFVGFNLTFFPMHITGLLGHAAAGLHLSERRRLGPAQPADHDRRLRARRRDPRDGRQPGLVARSRRAGGRQTRGVRTRSSGRFPRRPLPTTSGSSRS